MSGREDADDVLGGLVEKIEKSVDEIAGQYDWSRVSSDRLDQLAFQYAVTVRDFLYPYIRNQSKLKGEMGQKIRVKGTDNTTYVVDYVGGQILDILLKRSIESGHQGGWLYYVKDHTIEQHYELRTASKTDLKGSYLITPHFKKERRIAFSKTPLFSEKVQTFNMGGPLCICRLAEGRDNEIHGYLDFSEEKKGQPIYEIVYFPIAIKAGAYVTDMDGNEFDFAALVSRLEQDPKARYRFVAACTRELHQALIAKVT